MTVNNHENLSIKNKRDPTNEIGAKSEDSTKKAISIKSNSEIYRPIKRGENIDSITMDSINLQTRGFVIVDTVDSSTNVHLTVKSLTAHKAATCNIENIKVDGPFTISQSASLNLENVKLEKTQIKLNMLLYTENYKSSNLYAETLEIDHHQ